MDPKPESGEERNLSGIKKRSSLRTYWKVLRLVFERAMEKKLDAKLKCKMHRVPISIV